jgi:hypothetical protein
MRQLPIALAIIVIGITSTFPTNDRSGARQMDPPISQFDDLARCLARELAGSHARYALVTASPERLAFITIWHIGPLPFAQLRIAEDASGNRSASWAGNKSGETIASRLEAAMLACRLQS